MLEVFYHSRTTLCSLLKLNFNSMSPGPKPTQKQLLQQLYHTVADKWNPIGIYLEIPEGHPNAIDAKHRGNPQKCLMAMLTESWLPRVSPPPTWEKIAEGVEFVGYPDVAQKLRDKFCVIQTVQLNNIVAFHLDANYLTCLIVFHRLTVFHSHLKL